MPRDPRVDLAAHNLARQVATGIDPNDADRLIHRVERWGWEDWCRFWTEEAARHQKPAKEAAARAVSAGTGRRGIIAIFDHQAEREGAAGNVANHKERLLW